MDLYYEEGKMVKFKEKCEKNVAKID